MGFRATVSVTDQHNKNVNNVKVTLENGYSSYTDYNGDAQFSNWDNTVMDNGTYNYCISDPEYVEQYG